MFNLIQSISTLQKDAKTIQRKLSQMKSDKQAKTPVKKKPKLLTLTEFMALK